MRKYSNNFLELLSTLEDEKKEKITVKIRVLQIAQSYNLVVKIILKKESMRLVHLSDLHVSAKRFKNDNRLPIEELILDLVEWNSKKKIDLILITGDLVDKGGSDFKSSINYYEEIEEKIIKKIYTSIGLDKNNVFIIPGNHDIQRNKINSDTYEGLRSRLTSNAAINEHITKFK